MNVNKGLRFFTDFLSVRRSAKHFFRGLRGDLEIDEEVEGRGVGVGVTSISMVVFRFLLFGLAPVEDPEALALVCRLEEDIFLFKTNF